MWFQGKIDFLLLYKTLFYSFRENLILQFLQENMILCLNREIWFYNFDRTNNLMAFTRNFFFTGLARKLDFMIWELDDFVVLKKKRDFTVLTRKFNFLDSWFFCRKKWFFCLSEKFLFYSFGRKIILRFDEKWFFFGRKLCFCVFSEKTWFLWFWRNHDFLFFLFAKKTDFVISAE